MSLIQIKRILVHIFTTILLRDNYLIFKGAETANPRARPTDLIIP